MSGIKSKLSKLKRKLAIINYDIIIIIETWLTPDICSNEIMPASDTCYVFRTVREDTSNPRKKGGGVMIAVNKRL